MRHWIGFAAVTAKIDWQLDVNAQDAVHVIPVSNSRAVRTVADCNPKPA